MRWTPMWAAALLVSCASGSETPGAGPSLVNGPEMKAAPSTMVPPQNPSGPVMGMAGLGGGAVQPTMPGTVGMAGSGPVTTTPPTTTPPMATTTPPTNMMMTTTPPTEKPMLGSKTPMIPAVKGECPAFRDGTVSLMGVSGITMVAGAKSQTPSPMVMYWHGTGSFAGEYAGMAAAVSTGVKSEGGVLVSFQSSSGQGDASCSGTFIFSLGDMDVTDQFVACAIKDHNVDPRQIFTTGCSAGGLFSACLAARRSSYIAAAAPNSGGFAFPQPFQNDYTPALMTVHGAMGRDVVGIDFSTSSATADRVFKMRGGFVINCDHGGGHCGGAGQAPAIWKFFKAHPYGVDPYPWKDALPAGFDPKCKLYM